MPLFDGYNIYASLCQPRERGGTARLFQKKKLGLKISRVLVDLEGKLDVFDVNHNKSSAFRMLNVYATNDTE